MDKQLEKCPAGAVGDGYTKDLNAFLNGYKCADLLHQEPGPAASSAVEVPIEDCII